MQLTIDAAIDFIVSQIAEEAERQGIPLVDIEREVLYFSESPETPPETMDVMETFDREYDQDTYERKIVRLLKGAYKRTRSSRKEEWTAALGRLEDVDVYLGVIIVLADFRRAGDFWRLLATAFGLIGLIVAFLIFVEPAIARHLTPEQQGFYLWLSALAAAFLYTVARWIFGAAALDRVSDRLLEAIVLRRRREPPAQSRGTGGKAQAP